MTEFMQAFLAEYGMKLVGFIVILIAGFLGRAVYKLYAKYATTKTTQAVCKTVVLAVEQAFKDLHGKEKLNVAIEYASSLLDDKGISVSPLELQTMIEAAVGEFNNAFNNSAETKTND